MNKMDLVFECVCKEFPSFSLGPLSFQLPQGYIMGLIGSNGAGKTTLIRLLLNMLPLDEGEIQLFGLDSVRDEKKIKQQLGVVFDSNYFVDTWTIGRTAKALSDFYEAWDNARFQELVTRFQLPMDGHIHDLSRGMQMKLMLTCALSHHAKLLVLDEPTSGLDPATRDELLTLLQEFIADGEHSVLFSTHITSDLERAADYITYLEDGRQVYSGTTEGLLDHYRLIKGAPDELAPELMQHLHGVRQTALGFEGLIDAETAALFGGYLQDAVTLEDIMIYIGKEKKL